MQKLTIAVLFVVTITVTNSSPRVYSEKIINNSNGNDENGIDENFVLIGGSSTENLKPKIVDDKAFRSGHYYSLVPIAVAHTKPNSDYYSPNLGYHPSHHPTPGNGLINANVHLLEPFMLVTFLLFVLCLVDKARSLPIPISRFDRDFQLYEGYNNYINRNQTEF